MTDEKGYIRFRCEWEPADPPAGPLCDELRACRDRLHRLGLVGVYPNGIGYGNLSVRTGPGEAFVVTGTATGGVPSLGPDGLTEVTAFDIDGNAVRCRGPVRASSESLSHAAVYRYGPAARAVVHVHQLGLWERLYGEIPTTDPAAEAGTPEMGRAIAALFADTAVRETRLFVMGGHREGLMSFGATPGEATAVVVEALEQIAARG